MNIATISNGATLRITAELRDTSNALADPDTVRFITWNPATRVRTTYTYGADAQVARVSTGVYVATTTYTGTGAWTVGFEAVSGTQVARAAYTVTVEASEVFG